MGMEDDGDTAVFEEKMNTFNRHKLKIQAIRLILSSNFVPFRFISCFVVKYMQYFTIIIIMMRSNSYLIRITYNLQCIWRHAMNANKKLIECSIWLFLNSIEIAYNSNKFKWKRQFRSKANFFFLESEINFNWRKNDDEMSSSCWDSKRHTTCASFIAQCEFVMCVLRISRIYYFAVAHKHNYPFRCSV